MVRIRDARFGRHVRERPIPVVSIKHVGTDVGDVQIHVAVVVIIAARTAEPVAGIPYACTPGDIGEVLAVAVIAIQAIRQDVSFDGSWHSTSLNQVHVQIVIAVVIEQPAAGSHDLWEPHLATGTVVVAEVDADAPGHIRKDPLVLALAWLAGRGLLRRCNRLSDVLGSSPAHVSGVRLPERSSGLALRPNIQRSSNNDCTGDSGRYQYRSA